MNPRSWFPRARFEYWPEEARAHWWRLVWLRAYERALLTSARGAQFYNVHRHEKAAAGRWIRAKP